ncbi:MAG: penicillin-binding protein 2 [Pseudomonadales bacterium]
MKNRDFKDPIRENRVFTFRAILFWIVVVCLTCVLAGRIFYLQVMQHDRYATASENNRVLLQPIVPNRGLIYDTNGKLLANNRASQSLNLIIERVDDVEQTLALLQSLLPITKGDLARFEKRRKQRRRPHEPIQLRTRLTEQEIAILAVNSHRLSGVTVEAELVRHYPFSKSTAHVLGYVGRINEKELKRIDPVNYSGTQRMGKLGVEKFYEAQLHGLVGFQKVEVTARGRVLRVLEREDPVPGADITLYLDSNLQDVAEQALGDRRGAVVAIDTQTGGIIAQVSQPSFDPNLFVTGIDTKSYAALRDSLDLPLFNRALRGQYPPGSTVKPFVALAGLEYGHINWAHTISDPGWYQLTKGGRFYRDWKKWGHGKVDLNLAIAQSCDTYFYELAHKMNVDDLHDFLWQFGFGQRISLDVAEALKGILPSTVWKKARTGEPWYTGDSLNVGIGQGYMLATPLQLATATAVLANRGKWLQPRMLKTIRVDKDYIDMLPATEEIAATPDDVTLKRDANWEKMIDAMESVIHGRRGTAQGIGKDVQYRIAGKTGTAQVVGIKQDEEYDIEKVKERNQDHGLFVAFAPADEPRIAIAVIVENGGGGSKSAAPVARKVMDAYLLPKLAAQAEAAISNE